MAQDLPYGATLWAQPVSAATGPAVNAGGVVNGASFAADVAVSPGELVTVFGTNFSPAAEYAASPLPANLNGLEVSVKGDLAPIVFANGTQVNLQLPWDTKLGTAVMAVSENSVVSNAENVQVIPASPGIFLYNGNLAVAQDASYQLITTGSPATPGSTIIVYMTGPGPLNLPLSRGEAAPASPLSYVQSTIAATVGSSAAHVSFAGMSPGFVGLLQVNVDLPAGLAAGTYPLIVMVNGVASNAATLNVGP